MKRRLYKFGLYVLFVLLLAGISLMDAYALFLLGFSLLTTPALSLVVTVVFGILTGLVINRLVGPLLDALLSQ